MAVNHKNDLKGKKCLPVSLRKLVICKCAPISLDCISFWTVPPLRAINASLCAEWELERTAYHIL